MKRTRFDWKGNGSRVPRSMQVFLACMFVVGTALAVFFSTGGIGAGTHASDVVKLPGHVVGLIRQSQLLGPSDPNASIKLSVSMQPRNAAELKAYATEISSPHSKMRGHFLTSDQAANIFGASPSAQNAVIAYMQQAGFQVTKTYNNRLLIDFKGTFGQAEKAFQIQINNYRSPAGRKYFATESDPSVPASISSYIQGIIGLDNARVYKHLSTYNTTGVRAKAVSATTCPTASSGLGYLPSQIATAYNLNGMYAAGFHGEGQKVALFELDDFAPSDISAYTGCFGGSSVSINRVLVNGGTGVAPGAGAIEVELDMELILSGAPALSELRVYEAANNTVDAVDEYAQIANDGLSVVSTSWGSCESSGFAQSVYTTESNIFAFSAIEGQSVFAAAGDSGSNDCGNATPTTPSVDDPASQPFVTAVGGTTLTLNNDNSYHSESVWNQGRGIGGGGGVSNVWPMPSWQQGPGVINTTYSSGTPCNVASGNYCRQVPDVSLDADPHTGYVMYCTAGSICSSFSNPWFPIGGTSAAAPMWAVMATLANHKFAHDGFTKLGFLNPLIYQIGQSNLGTSYSNDFQDVQVGNNYTTGDGKNEYPAGLNYDMASGWGSYNALNLAADLESLAKPSATNVPAVSRTWYFAEGKVGQGFTEYLTMQNADAVNDCSVTINYLLSSGSPVTKNVLVAHGSRFTESVNSDLGVNTNASANVVVSVILNVNVAVTPKCAGIVAERPIYFTNFAGINSGTDAVGATKLGYEFEFADVPNMTGYASFISILNPPTNNPANIVVRYYAEGIELGVPQLLTVLPGTRGTIVPPAFTQHVSADVSSSQPVMVERATYFHGANGGNGGTVSGAEAVVGAANLANRWLFAEGYTGPGFQEYLVLANILDKPIIATTVLEYSTGHWQQVQYTIQPETQVILDVNALNMHPAGTCDTNPCQTSTAASIDVSTFGEPFVAEREMFFHYNHSANGRSVSAMGGTDVLGQPALPQDSTSIPAAYSFAEGYTNNGYDEWLTLQNPTNATETIHLTLVNGKGHSYTQDIPVVAFSRSTIDITALVAQHLALPGDGYLGYEVSMTVTSNNGPFVAERPMYWNTGATEGGSDVIGFNRLSN